jgi:hypothetical protein
MAVAANGVTGKSVLHIPNAVWMTKNASIRQDGITSIGGNFYQDAITNIFYRFGGNFASTGKIVFFKDNGAANTGTCRYVTTNKSGDIDAFDRGQSFIAFPEIEIRTKDTVVVHARMGIDALKLIRNTGDYGNDLGKLLLESKVVSGKSYDASLRITGASNLTSEQLVPPGSVIVERDLTPYRLEDAGTGNGSLFAFASPFKNMRSGYFAGNWIRRMLEDAENNGHVEYVYGNKRDASDVILGEQYIIDPTEGFEPGKGYLVKLRATGFDYSALLASGGLPITSGGDASDYDVSKFIFNGAPYRMPGVDEQLFTDDVLFERSIDLAANTSPTYINWVIGNSWTSPIDINKLVDLMGNSTLYFKPFIYVFPSGSTNYQVYKCTATDPSSSMTVIDLDEIPAMSYFMLRLDNKKKQDGTFMLRRNELLTHGNASHSTLKSAKVESSFHNEVLFRVSPESNPGIYDLAGIGLRPNGNPNADSNDILKPGSSSTGSGSGDTGSGTGSELFGLYSVSGDGRRLSANIVPETSDAVPLHFSPGTFRSRFKLEASRMESLKTSSLWLEDTKEGIITDLFESGGSYGFEVSPEDEPGRFVVRFQNLVGTDLKDFRDFGDIRVFVLGDRLIVRGLSSDDIGARLAIYDVQGQLLQQTPVTQSPEMDMAAPSTEGIYIFRLEGKRVITLKFRK